MLRYENEAKILYLHFFLGGDWNSVPAVSARAFPVPGPAAEAGVPRGSRHAQVSNLQEDS
jgi:hypothetical protein